MHDIKAIREDPDGFDRDLNRRGLKPASNRLMGIDEYRRSRLTQQQALQEQRNDFARRIGLIKRQGGDTAELQAEAAAVGGSIAFLQERIIESEGALQDALASLPNRLDPDVQAGDDESGNEEIKRHGEIRTLSFAAQQHFDLGNNLGMMDFEGAAKLSGARFTVLFGALARLERALGQFMVDWHVTKNGYEETAVPGLVNRETLFGTGQFPKFIDDCFKIESEERWLIPTAEVPLTNLAAGRIVPLEMLPRRQVALTDCYRSEAGSAGRDTRGMLRQHQFKKVELVSIVAPEDSDAEHERLTRCAETVLERLELPYRRMLLCAGDTGFSAAKTYDLEVWLPGQGAWREISSCSNCRDFQARRMNARTRAPDGKGTRMLHTLNGSGVAVGRALIAVMENYQQEDGSITVPEVLRPYMAGLEVIRAA